MFDEQDAVPLLQALQQFDHHRRFLRTHSGHRFVEQEELGFGRERHGQLELPTLAIGSYVSEERTGPLDKLVASATAFDPAVRPPMAQVAAELAAWLNPVPTTDSQISLDTAKFAAEMDRRRLAMEAERELQQRTADVAGQAGLRLREAFRSFAREIEAALISAHFDSVVLSIDNYNWGFE